MPHFLGAVLDVPLVALDSYFDLLIAVGDVGGGTGGGGDRGDAAAVAAPAGARLGGGWCARERRGGDCGWTLVTLHAGSLCCRPSHFMCISYNEMNQQNGDCNSLQSTQRSRMGFIIANETNALSSLHCRQHFSLSVHFVFHSAVFPFPLIRSVEHSSSICCALPN